jgi:hypothetical protein
MSGDRSSYSNGSALRKGNYLILKDSMIEGFNIDVRERFDSSLTQIRINPARYSDSNTEISAVFWPNCDSARKCPLTVEDCSYEMGSIKGFCLEVEGFQSKKYRVISQKSNIFDIYIKSDYPLFKYQTWIGYKILIVSPSVLKLFEDTEKGRARKSIILRKVE